MWYGKTPMRSLRAKRGVFLITGLFTYHHLPRVRHPCLDRCTARRLRHLPDDCRPHRGPAIGARTHRTLSRHGRGRVVGHCAVALLHGRNRIPLPSRHGDRRRAARRGGGWPQAFTQSRHSPDRRHCLGRGGAAHCARDSGRREHDSPQSRSRPRGGYAQVVSF